MWAFCPRMDQPYSSDILSTMHPGSPSSLPSSCSTPKRKRMVSPSSPSSSSNHRPSHPRSASRSTVRSIPTSCRSSQLSSSHHRVPTTASLTPSVRSRCPPDQKRETLLALHRDSCRLFQDPSTTATCPPSMTKPTIHSPSAASSDTGTPPLSPGLYSQSSASERSLDQAHLEHGPAPVYHIPGAEPSYKQPSTTTVIDWTSASTRRREYAKIDRSSRGVRGLWRKVAPRWCQFGNDRMPFFDPGKNPKANYEGSVRRFRMDLPDEPSPHNRGIWFKLGSRRHTTV